MKFLLQTLLLFGGLNLILARSLYWGPYNTHVASPWTNYYYDDELFALPSRQNSDEESEFEKISKLFDKSSEDFKLPTETKTSDEVDKDDVLETLRGKQLKEFESFLGTMMGVDSIEYETKIDDKSKESTKEKADDNDDDNDTNEKDNTGENINDDTDTSEEEISVNDKVSAEVKKPLVAFESRESKETLSLNNSNEDDDVDEKVFSNSQATKFSEEKLEEHDENVSEKDIRELTAILMTLSTLDDLMKIAENSSENEDLLSDDELNEKKLKEVNDYLILFGSLLDKILDESAEKQKETEKSDNDDDNHSKEDESEPENEGEKDNEDDDDDDKENNDDSKDNDNDEQRDNNQRNHNEDASVSLDFHSIENSNTNLDNHKYDVLPSSSSVVQFKPTSSPHLPETFSSNAENNNVIQEYVEVREKIDTLQDNLLVNKLEMDKDFYNIIANESDDKNMKKFSNDIAALRDNAYKIKQSVDNMQDIKSKLYFHKLIKAALKGAQSH